MVIVFANQKGGVGKTTFVLGYANHLALSGRKVLVYDSDPQRNCLYRRDGESSSFAKDAIRYQIECQIPKSIDDGERIMKNAHQFSSENDTVVLIDLPGDIKDNSYIPFFRHADFIVCPFFYQAFSLDSTSTFIKVMHGLKKHYTDMRGRLVFIPNKVNRRAGTAEELESYRQVDEVFKNLGVLTPRVFDRVELQRISTIIYTPKQQSELAECFACLDSLFLS